MRQWLLDRREIAEFATRRESNRCHINHNPRRYIKDKVNISLLGMQSLKVDEGDKYIENRLHALKMKGK